MKKFWILILALFLSATAYAGHDKPITFDKLPAKAQQFIKTHFVNKKIAIAKKEVEFIGKSYDVIFTNGDKVEFSGDGNWTGVKCKYSEVPSAIVPKQILDYVAQNYPGAKIIDIECKSRYYEVGLSNRLEIKFNKQFVVINIDD